MLMVPIRREQATPTQLQVLYAAGTAAAKRKVVLVVFLGGVTFAVIAALRFIGRRPDVNCAFVIATTKLINGSTLLDTFMDEDVKAVREFATLK